MIPATEGVLRLQMKSKSSMPCTALGWRPLEALSVAVSFPWAVCVWSLDLLNKASCLWVEEGVCRSRAQRPAGSDEALDVVVGSTAVGGGTNPRG